MRLIEVQGAVALPASELLVLEGALGDLGAGTYAIVPAGTLAGDAVIATAPRDAAPCVIRPDDRAWQVVGRGVERATLCRDAAWHTRLTRVAPGTHVHHAAIPDGEDLIVVDGDLHDDAHDLGPRAHVTYPPGSMHDPRSDAGCVLFVRSPAPVREAAIATARLYAMASCADVLTEAFPDFGTDHAWLALIDPVCDAAIAAWQAAPVDGVDLAAMLDQRWPTDGPRFEAEAYYRRLLGAEIDAFARAAPARLAGPAFFCVRALREALRGPLRT